MGHPASTGLFPFAPLVLAAASAALLLAGCATGPPPGPSPAELAGQNAKVVIISPMNVVSALPPELEGSTKMVSKEMVAYLEAHGKTAKRMAFRAGRDLWKASMEEVRDSGQKRNFENAARVYARKIGEHLEFDAVIVPSLFVQNAKVWARKAKWDDAEQMIEISGAIQGSQPFHGQDGTFYMKGASLFLHVLDRDGETVHTKRQGVEMIQHIELRSEKEAGYSSRSEHKSRIVDDQPPISDPELVREAIAKALVPFLPEDVAAKSGDTAANAEAESETQ